MTQDTNITLESISARFRSGNSVPVERAHITAEEWQAVEAAYAELKAENGRLKEKQERMLTIIGAIDWDAAESLAKTHRMRSDARWEDYNKRADLETQLAALQQLADGRLEQLNADRRQYLDLRDQLAAYEKHGVTCQTYRHSVDEPCSECNVKYFSAPISAIPPGYAVVPIEPTVEMYYATDGLRGHIKPTTAMPYEQLQTVWQAMLAAAPAI